MTTDRVDVLRGVLAAEYEVGQVRDYDVHVIEPSASDSSFAGGADYAVRVSRCPSWTLEKIREAGFGVTAFNSRDESPGVQIYLEDNENDVDDEEVDP